MITVVIGKPGAGKSYDTVARLVEDIVDRVNRSAEIPLVYTNLKLNIDEFVEYVRRQTRKKDLDLSIELMSDEFLSGFCWWRQLPDNSRIILDESQFYWSSRKIDPAEQQDLIECLSTHRHRRQDFILLTQSLTSISVDIRKYAEVCIEVLNAKSLTLPFPISIPLRDIQTLAAAFGSRRQIYRTREGLLEGTFKVTWEGELKVCHTSPKIYALYRSTDKKEQGDSALPFALGPGAWRRGLKWFLFKHGGHLLIKSMFVIVPCVMLYVKLQLHKVANNAGSSSESVQAISKTAEKSNGMEIMGYTKIYGDGWRITDGGTVVDDDNVSARGSGL